MNTNNICFRGEIGEILYLEIPFLESCKPHYNQKRRKIWFYINLDILMYYKSVTEITKQN